MISFKHYFKLSGVNNCQLFIAFCSNSNIVFSDGSIIKFDQKKWAKANCKVGEYIKMVLNIDKKLTNCSQNDFLIDTKQYNQDGRLDRLFSGPHASNNKDELVLNTEGENSISENESLVKINYLLKQEVTELKNKSKDLSARNEELYWEVEEWKYKKKPKGVMIVKSILTAAPLKTELKFDGIEEYKKLQTKLDLTESDLRKILKYNSELEKEKLILAKKLENAQKFIQSLIPRSKLGENINRTTTKDESDVKFKADNKLDGSSNFYERRESGRYGSFPSFDNYDDEYNEKSDL